MRLALLVVVFTLAGCYFYYPKLPSQPQPQLVDGERVEIHTQRHDYLRTCDPERERNCHHTGRAWKKESSYTTAEITYDGRRLSQWEARRLVDPEFDSKLARIKSKRSTCSVSLVPSVISVVGLAVLSYGGLFVDRLGTNARYVGIGAMGAAAGGAIASYPLGGYACMSARRDYRAMFGNGLIAPGSTSVRLGSSSGAYLEEMQALTRRFNAEMKGRNANADAEPDADP